MEKTFELDKYFKAIKKSEEHWTDVDGSQQVDYYKEITLGEALTLILFDSGQATLKLENDEGNMEHTFYWDDEAAAMFERFDEVRAAELFGMIYRKRWRSLPIEEIIRLGEEMRARAECL